MKKTRRVVSFLLCAALLFTAFTLTVPAMAEKASVAQSAALAQAKASAKSITISGSDVVAKGKKITLKAAVSPAGASQDVVWTSGNSKIATVSAKGVVKGVKAGTVTIKATSLTNPFVTQSWEMKVTAKPVTSIAISGVKKMKVYDQITLKAKVKPAAASQRVEWKSSKPKVATVTDEGVVKAVGEGKTTITAAATDGSNAKIAVTLTVKGTPKAGWSSDGMSFYDEKGKPVTGWQRIDHMWYFFKPDGIKLVGDPNQDPLEFLYSDKKSGLYFVQGQFRPDGTYDISAGEFSRSAEKYDEKTETWSPAPFKLVYNGKEYEPGYISLYFYSDGTMGLYINFGDDEWTEDRGTWKQDGDNVKVTAGKNTYTFTQNKFTFTLTDSKGNTMDLKYFEGGNG